MYSQGALKFSPGTCRFRFSIQLGWRTATKVEGFFWSMAYQTRLPLEESILPPPQPTQTTESKNSFIRRVFELNLEVKVFHCMFRGHDFPSNDHSALIVNCYLVHKLRFAGRDNNCLWHWRRPMGISLKLVVIFIQGNANGQPQMTYNILEDTLLYTFNGDR